MSDWDDDDSNIIAQPAPKQSRQCNDDDWDDEPQNVCTISFALIIMCWFDFKS